MIKNDVQWDWIKEELWMKMEEEYRRDEWPEIRIQQTRTALDALWPADESGSTTIQIPSNSTSQEIADMAVGQATAVYQKIMQGLLARAMGEIAKRDERLWEFGLKSE